MVRAVNGDDPEKLMDFFVWFMILHVAIPGLTKKIRWTTFKTNGRVNEHNCVNWNDEHTQRMIEEDLIIPKMTVWTDIWPEDVTGPLFI
jgi:hypothetical protein